MATPTVFWRAVLRSLEAKAGPRLPPGQKGPGDYGDDPVRYAEHILGVKLTPNQQTILRHLLIPPC
jgi:hypothetical protein